MKWNVKLTQVPTFVVLIIQVQVLTNMILFSFLMAQVLYLYTNVLFIIYAYILQVLKI